MKPQYPIRPPQYLPLPSTQPLSPLVPPLQSESPQAFPGIHPLNILHPRPAHMLALTFPTTEIRTRSSREEGRALSRQIFSIPDAERTRWNVQHAGIGLARVHGVDGVNRVTMPASVVTRSHARHVHHCVWEVEVRVQGVSEFLAMAGRGALEPGVGRGEVEVPV